MDKRSGNFIISLDFELMYGMSDRSRENRWRHCTKGARQAIPQILELFEEYEIKATWAIVGMLFADTKEELETFFPKKLPQYEQSVFSNYALMNEVGENEEEDPFHFAGSLIRQIAKMDSQEIATHTFSHYYCMEEGQTAETFAEDVTAAIAIAKEKGIEIESLVFPKNQFRSLYLKELESKGIIAVRGNEALWFYKASKSGENIFKRLLRLADNYLNLTGYHCYPLNKMEVIDGIVNVQASRFLRPFCRKLKLFEILKIIRVKAQMRYAAKKGLVFHMWWHPHNFGSNTERNLHNLKVILDYYRELQEKYSFESITMSEAARRRKKEL